ncbi:MAG: hypothetical protein AAB441_01525 [Patescibacteria group bacterium]
MLPEANKQILTLKPGGSLRESLSLEDRKMHQWFKNLGNLLKIHPSDDEFRRELDIGNPKSMWSTRPLILQKLDFVPQFWFHNETVGQHINHVARNLDTTGVINKPDVDRVKVIRAATLFHDNGKRNDPTNPKHSLDSAQEVEHYLKWMDFNKKEIELCLHLIANHDFLGKIVNSQTKETIDDVLKICPTLEILNCLFILTKADIGSIENLIKISPNILNDIDSVYVKAKKKLLREKGEKLLLLPR